MTDEACRNGRLWSAEDDELLTKLVSDEVQIAAIAEMLGRTVGAVQTRVCWLDLRPPLAGRAMVTCPKETGDHRFEDVPASALHAELRIIGRHLPSRPLPRSTGSAAALCMEG